MLRPHVNQHLVGANVEFNDPRVVNSCAHFFTLSVVSGPLADTVPVPCLRQQTESPVKRWRDAIG
jgi:hypothetical protein